MTAQITGERWTRMSDIVRGVVDFAHLTWGDHNLCVKFDR